MIASVKNNKNVNLKTKIVNSLLISGNKQTSEKILVKFAKRLQKLTHKNFKKLFQLAVINSTLTFKLNEQIIKKGKRKAMKSTPSFILNDSLRVSTSLKLIKTTISKSKSPIFFYESLANEILLSSKSKSQSVDKKTELQRQILLNKRYLSKFRW